METPHNTEVEAQGMRPPPAPAGDGPAAPHDRPVPAPPATRVLLATVVALAVGVVTGWVARTALGVPHPAEITRPAASPPPAAPPPTAPAPALEANVVTVDAAEAQRLQIAPVQLRAFQEEKTAVGRIAFNDDHTTAIFAAFQGRVQRLVAKPGDVLHVGSPLLVLDSSDLGQANADLLAAQVAVQKAQNQLTQAARVATRQKSLYEAGVGAYKDVEQADADLRNAQHDLQTV